jgi:DnaJ-class molecular chaperone
MSEDFDPKTPCKGCKGTGEVAPHRTAEGFLSVICPRCNGYRFERQETPGMLTEPEEIIRH